MTVSDPYVTLGVATTATEDEIKKAYRKLVRQYHPDKNPGDAAAEEKFKEIQAAYDLLSDAEKRREWDSRGSSPFGATGAAGSYSGWAGAGPSGSGGFRVHTATDEDISSLFGDLLGDFNHHHRPRPRRGADVAAHVRISFEQSLSGADVKVSIPSGNPCPTCGGTGATADSEITLCSECSGRGQVLYKGSFEDCPVCHGKGTVVINPCPTCHGSGESGSARTLTVKIPAGVKDGMKIRVPGRGAAGASGGQSGDLYVVCEVEESKQFQRDGSNLIVDVPVSFPDAALGGEVRVPTPDGSKISLKVPAGSQDGKLLRIRGRGVPQVGKNERGDLLARLKIQVPETLSAEQRRLLEELRSLS